MRNRTDIAGLSVFDRLRQLAKTYKGLWEVAANLIFGFILANSTIFSSLAPFGVAYTAASGTKSYYFSAIGAILGYIASFNESNSMRYIAAVFLVVVLKTMADNIKLKRINGYIAPIVAAVSLAAVSGYISINTFATSYDIILMLSEVLLASAASFFFSKSMMLYENKSRLTKRTELSCIIITYCILVIALNSFKIFDFYVGRVVALTVILLSALIAHEAGGAVIGITTGIALVLSGVEYSYVAAAYAFGGLIAGVFAHTGRFGAAIALTVVNAAAAVITGIDNVGFASLFECFAATVLFMFVPNSSVKLLSRVFTLKTEEACSEGEKDVVLSKLRSSAEALMDIASTTQKVSQKLNSTAKRDINSVTSKTAEMLCKRCSQRSVCWQTDYNYTMDIFNHSLEKLKANPMLAETDLPDHFRHKCIKTAELVNLLSQNFSQYNSKENVRRKYSQVREVVSDQFEGMGILLSEIYGEKQKNLVFHHKQTEYIKAYFERMNINAMAVRCYSDTTERITVEIEIIEARLQKLDLINLAIDLADICEREFDMPVVRKLSDICVIVLHERPIYLVDFAASQKSCSDNKMCGDSYKMFSDESGRANIIVADGMGTGFNAAIDSTMTTSLLERLLENGVGYEAALKLVNSALIIKSNDESLSTIDIASIDLYSGQCEFLKAGAAPTFIKKDGRAGFIESTSLPAGIITGVDFERTSLKLGAGDLILMVSDGVTATGTDWVKEELENFNGTPKELCNKIVTTAKLRRNDCREDDITAVAALIINNKY